MHFHYWAGLCTDTSCAQKKKHFFAVIHPASPKVDFATKLFFKSLERHFGENREEHGLL